MARGTTRTLPVYLCPDASFPDPNFPSRKGGEKLGNVGLASFCIVLSLFLLMRTREVGEGGWETWRRAAECGGGGGVEKVEAGMMEEFRV